MGNGLRPDIWPEFKKRFNIENIHEFYAATEGNLMVMNMDNKVGTVGRYPQILHVSLVLYSLEKKNPADTSPVNG